MPLPWRLPLLLLALVWAALVGRWSATGETSHGQFPPGSEHLRLPPMLLYSLQMTTAFTTRSYFSLTLESMR